MGRLTLSGSPAKSSGNVLWLSSTFTQLSVTGDVHSSPVIEYRDFLIPKKRNSYFSHREMLILTASGLGNPPERDVTDLKFFFYRLTKLFA